MIPDMTNLIIGVGSDISAFEECGRVQSFNNRKLVIFSCYHPITGRFVVLRLDGANEASMDILALCEIEVLGDSDKGNKLTYKYCLSFSFPFPPEVK